MSEPVARTAPAGPPHNLEAERSVLGALFIKPAAYHEVASILRGTDDFFLPAHREIWDAIVAVTNSGRPIDVIAVGDELRRRNLIAKLDGGEVYLLTLSNSVPTAENVGHYAHLVAEKASMRRLIAACADIQTRARGDYGDPRDFLAEARGIIDGASTAAWRGPVKIGKLIDGALATIESRVGKKRLAVTTGLLPLDALIGGFYPENLIVVAQRPGQGKSALALNCAVRAARDGVPVLVFSMEMSNQENVERAIAFDSRVTADDLRRGRVEVEHFRKIDEARRLRELPLFFEDREDLSFEELLDVTARWAHDVDRDAGVHHAPKMAWVDSMSLLSPRRPKRIRMEDVSLMSRGLKKLARRLKMPIGLLMHINRSVEKEGKGGRSRRPRMSDLRESGAVEQDADLILLPYRATSDHPVGPTAMTIIVEKHRGGRTGDVHVTWDPRYLAFTEPTPDDPRPGESPFEERA